MKFNLLILLLFSVCNCFGQLTNDGGILHIQAGATVYADTNIVNKNTATTSNEGILKTTNHLQNNSGSTLNGNGQYYIQQDWTNVATFTKGTSKVIFNNTGNSNLTSGGNDFYDLEMSKDSGNHLTLLDNTTISNNLNFAADSNNISIENFNLTMDASATLTNFDSNKYVITGGTGQLIKNTMSNFTFPVGFDANTYNPVILTENGTVDNIGVRCLENVLENGTSGNALTEDFVSTSWEITEAVANGSNFDLEGQWAATDELINFNRSGCGIAFYTGSDWQTPSYTTAIGSNPYTQSSAGLTQFGVFSVNTNALLLSAKVFLEGAYESGLMHDSLRALNYLPLGEPYQALGFGGTGGETVDASVFTVTGNDAIVDWIFIELRDKSNSSNVLHTRPALVQRDGDVVDLDGTSTAKITANADDFFVAIRHRNHLGVMSANTFSLSKNTTLVDFSTITTFGTNAQKDLGSGIFGMFAADVDASGSIDSADRISTWAGRNLLNYSAADANLNGKVNAKDRSLSWNNRGKNEQLP